ncbi:MAG: RnfABCDGE type electron transport complex subunit G [Guyparkeria sp.]
MINLELRRVLITAVVLAVFFGLGVGFVAYTEQKTADQIELNRQAVLLGQIMAVLQGEMHDNNPAEDGFLLPDPEALNLGEPVIRPTEGEVLPTQLPAEQRELAMSAGQLGFGAREDGEVVAVAIPVVTHRGYSGDIRLLVGVRADGELTGVRVLVQNETPGLGDKIKADKTNWIHAFTGRQLGDPPADDWAVKKDGGVFDQFTGATVSPRAVVEAVRNALEYVDRHHRLLFDRPSMTSGEEDEHE